jgi:hypothetical protein
MEVWRISPINVMQTACAAKKISNFLHLFLKTILSTAVRKGYGYNFCKGKSVIMNIY